jgi:hypothetical protein
LDAKLTELERRLPPAAMWGKRALGIATGGAGSGLALLALRRMRSRARRRKARTEVPPTPVTVKVFSSGAIVPAALGVAAIWAGVKIYEAKMRASGERRPRPVVAEVKPMPLERRA